MPSFDSRACAAAPMPGTTATGRSASRAAVSARPMIEKPRGFSSSEASFARNLLCDSPTDTVMPISSSTRFAKRTSVVAGLAWCRRSVPERSRKASSIDTGSTSGVSSSIRARTSRPTRRYLSMSGRTTTASGQAFRALNIGIAERTPNVRAT